MTLLKPGKRHKDVLALKSILRSQGYTITDASDLYDEQTANEVQVFQAQHLDISGAYLKPDRLVGEKTWWALENASGEAQRSKIKGGTVRGGLSEVRRSVLRFAEDEWRNGTREIPDGSNRGDGVEKFIVGYGAVAWCALSASWIVKQGSGSWPMGKREGGVLNLWTRAEEQGKARTLASGYKPVPGDLMVILNRFTSGPKKGKRTGTGHVSIVAAVDEKNYWFNTYGGNEGNRFKLGLRNMDQENLVGFINLFGNDSEGFKRGLLKGSAAVAGDSTR